MKLILEEGVTEYNLRDVKYNKDYDTGRSEFRIVLEKDVPFSELVSSIDNFNNYSSPKVVNDSGNTIEDLTGKKVKRTGKTINDSNAVPEVAFEI